MNLDAHDRESTLASLPRPLLGRVVGRAAGRVVPHVAGAEAIFGFAALEWLNALDATVRTVLRLADGESVSPFTLTLAAELARAVANAHTMAVREIGLRDRAGIETLESVCAAAAFAADAVRAPSSKRAARCAMQAFANAEVAVPELGKLIAFDLKAPVDPGDLWPFGEPKWFTEGQAKLEAARPQLPLLLDRPRS